MRRFFNLAIPMGILTLKLFASTASFEVSNAGTTGSGETLYRYTYTLSGFMLQKNTELTIRFDPALYGILSNPVAPAEFDVLLLQPDNPPGAFGDYSLLALVDNPPLFGPFSVDFTFVGSGLPGAQPFFINEYDSNLNFIRTVGAGTTRASSDPVVPEPATLALCAAGLLLAGFGRAVRRRPFGKIIDRR